LLRGSENVSREKCKTDVARKPPISEKKGTRGLMINKIISKSNAKGGGGGDVACEMPRGGGSTGGKKKGAAPRERGAGKIRSLKRHVSPQTQWRISKFIEKGNVVFGCPWGMGKRSSGWGGCATRL